jgi:hypothetical protein
MVLRLPQSAALLFFWTASFPRCLDIFRRLLYLLLCVGYVEWGDMLGQRERAARLFALALKARENGDDSLADKLVALALQILDDAPEEEPSPDDPKKE